MMFRRPVVALLMSVGLLTTPTTSRAMDCVVVRDDYDSAGQPIIGVTLAQSAQAKALCGSLKVVTRTRNDPRPNVRVSTTYLEFENPLTKGERLYNELIGKAVGQLSLSGKIDDPAFKHEHILDIHSFYRSPRLLSAQYLIWLCCGAHGFASSIAVNIDMERNAVLVPADLFRVGAVANFCWRQFNALDGQGTFARQLPLDKEFTDSDFERPRSASEPRTLRAFSETLTNPGSWSFTDSKIEIWFGYLLGYAPGPMVCSMDNAELRRMTRDGVNAPP